MEPGDFFAPVADELKTVESNLETNINSSLAVLQRLPPTSSGLVASGSGLLLPAGRQGFC